MYLACVFNYLYKYVSQLLCFSFSTLNLGAGHKIFVMYELVTNLWQLH
jgi:hypothetical protein